MPDIFQVQLCACVLKLFDNFSLKSLHVIVNAHPFIFVWGRRLWLETQLLIDPLPLKSFSPTLCLCLEVVWVRRLLLEIFACHRLIVNAHPFIFFDPQLWNCFTFKSFSPTPCLCLEAVLGRWLLLEIFACHSMSSGHCPPSYIWPPPFSPTPC